MQGVVTLLDEAHNNQVEELWTVLQRDFGTRAVYVTPFPHFSYQVAERYDVDRLREALQRIAGKAVAFTVHTNGLGVFTGPSPILYIPVVRSPLLARFQEALWSGVAPIAEGVSPLYQPDRWQPHITLAHADLTADTLAEVVRRFSGRNFTWEIPVTNLAVISDTGNEQVPRHRFDFPAS